MSDTGDVHVVEFIRGPGRPFGSDKVYLDTGPHLELYRLELRHPGWAFYRAARIVAPTIHNAEGMSDTGARVRRLRNGRPVWFAKYFRPEFITDE